MTAFRERIQASIEVLAQQVIAFDGLSDAFPRGVGVYIPDIGADSDETLVRAAKRLNDVGYVPVPHLAVRRVTSRAALEERIKALTQVAGVCDILLIGGDVKRAAGEFSASLQVLETGLLDRYGITDIGIAGHPEGSPNMANSVALQVLKLKGAFSRRSDARFRIVTQLSFDAQAVIAWAGHLRDHDIDLPVHVGVAGPAKVSTLIKYAAICGVGNSLNFLKKRTGSLTTLLTGFTPEETIAPIEAHTTSNPNSAIKQIHVFPFGGIKVAAEWLRGWGIWHAQMPPSVDRSPELERERRDCSTGAVTTNGLPHARLSVE